MQTSTERHSAERHSETRAARGTPSPHSGCGGLSSVLLVLLASAAAVVPSAAIGAQIIDHLDPSQGKPGGGVEVRVLGSGFIAGDTATLCGEPVAGLRFVSANELVLVAPPHEPAFCDLVLRDPDGVETTYAAGFRYSESAPEPPRSDGEPEAPEYRGRDTVVTGTRVARRLADTPVLTELISADRIEAKGAVCLLDALTYEPGVRVDNMCSICNTTGVKLSGMPGRYTSLLIDGVPIYSSLGQTYGWLMLSAGDIAKIEIVKGANSVLYGTDAIGGVVNVITRRPEDEPHARMTAEMGAYGYHYLTGSASAKKGDMGVSLVATHTSHDSIDRDGDQVSEYTGYDRANMASSFTWSTDRLDAMTRFSVTQEKRQGGGLGSFIEVLSDDTRRGMSESILSQRLEGSSVLDYHANANLDLETTLALTHHVQDSDYEGEVYVGDQLMIFAQQAAVAELSKRYSLVSGLAYRGEFLDENLAISDYQYHMGGVFLQGDWAPSHRFELLHGVRYDYHNVYGSIFTPRLSIRYSPLDVLTLRGTAGTGFRAPTTFYEYAHGVRPEGYEMLMEADKAERSLNASGSVVLDTGRALRASLETAFNRVQNPITVETSEEGNLVVFNADGDLDVLSMEAQIQSSPVEWLRMSAGYGHYIYTDPEGALVSAPPSDTVDLSADFDFAFGLLASLGVAVYGPMDLLGVYGPAFGGSGDMTLERWLDTSYADTGHYKQEKSPWYATIDARAEQEAGGGLSLYLGVKNLTDYHQSDIESPLMYPETQPGVVGPVDVIYIWGPLRGRFIYGGLKVDL